MSNNPVSAVDPDGGQAGDPPDKCPECIPMPEVVVIGYRKPPINYKPPSSMWNAPWSDAIGLGGNEWQKSFQRYLDAHPPVMVNGLKNSLHGITNRGGAATAKLIGELYTPFVELATYAQARANGKTGNLPDPTGLSSLIINEVSANIDENILSAAITNAYKVHNIEGLGRVMESISRRRDVGLNGTYVSDHELEGIQHQGFSPEIVKFKTYPFINDYPVINGTKYNNFVLYRGNTFMTIRMQ